MAAFAILLGFTILIGPWVVAGIALSRANASGRRAEALEKSVRELRARADRLARDLDARGGEAGGEPGEAGGEPTPAGPWAAGAPRAPAEPAPPPEPAAPAEPSREEEPPPATPRRPAETGPRLPAVPRAAPAGAPPHTPSYAAPHAPAHAPSRAQSVEQALTSRWLVWVGAVSIALGALFFVKYAIDQGWLGPAVRVAIGFAFGVALALGGEWLRRRPLQQAIAAVGPNYVPPALTAAGLFSAFASIYAAHALYGLLPPLVAFAGLAVTALAAVGLSLRQGWFVALLGLVGAYLTPALVATPEPSAWALFGYLLVIAAACLAVVRWCGWWWLAAATLAGAGLWPQLWLTAFWQPADALPLGLYLLLVAAAFLGFRYRLVPPPGTPQLTLATFRLLPHELLSWAGALTAAGLLFLMVERAGFSPAALAFVVLLALLFLAAGRHEALFDGLSACAAMLCLGVTLAWPLPAFVTRPRPLFAFDGAEIGTAPGTPLLPPELGDFTTALLVFAALFGIGGFVALWGARRPALWAGVSAATPILLMAVGYWRIAGFQLDFRWAFVALALAAVSLAAAARIARHRAGAGLAAPLGFYAAAVVAALSLGMAMTLQQAWLTVALSVQLPALAWIGRRISGRAIALVALAVAATVLVRLVANYNVLDYPLGASPGFSWVVYGYGVPAAMFFAAARLFRRDGATALLVTLLEAGGLAFTVLLVTLQLRILTTGAIAGTDYRLPEQSLQAAAWLGLGYALALHYRARAHPVSLWGARLLLGLALAQAVLFHAWLANPIFTGAPVGGAPLVNLLFLAYGVPALFAFALVVETTRPGGPRLVHLLGGRRSVAAAGIAGLVLVFAWLSLEVRRAFQGPVLAPMHQSDAELYAYSAAWLAYALVLLALGIARRLTALRYASLALLLLTVCKVFVVDMAGLTGLYRVGSFLGLGFTLVVIGYVYQRYVFRRPPAAPSGAAQENDG